MTNRKPKQKPIPHYFICPLCDDEFVMYVTLGDLEKIKMDYSKKEFRDIFNSFPCQECSEDRKR